MQSLCILGRQPKLGLAELESLFGSEHVTPFGNDFALSDVPSQEIPFDRIGGSIKLCRVIEQTPANDWRALEKRLLAVAPDLAQNAREGKITCGVSVYGGSVSEKDILATGLRLKKVIKSATGQSVRLVPNQPNETALTTAQILHNKLHTQNGLELVVAIHEGTTIIAKTVSEQNIIAYTKRDQNRPKRDARVGMLPPKLAQIIVNLAVGTLSEHKISTILDPFCGTGVLLQEAALMGYDVYGTDIAPRMIEYSAANLTWLNETHKLIPLKATLQTGDATTYEWKEPFQAVAAEGYLGQPFTGFPTEPKLREVTQTCNLIAKKFLQNLANQIPSGTRIAIGLPTWHKPNGTFVQLNLLDQLDDLGYNRLSFAHVSAEELLYYRPDQVVARQLLVITRK